MKNEIKRTNPVQSVSGVCHDVSVDLDVCGVGAGEIFTFFTGF